MTAPPRKPPPQFGLGTLLWAMVWTGTLVVAWQSGMLAWDEMLLPHFVVIGTLVLALPLLGAVFRNR